MNRRSVVFLTGLLIGLASFWGGCIRDQSQSPVGPSSSADPGISADKPASLSGPIRSQLRIAGHIDCSATADGCDNSGGPNITLSGELTLGGLNGRLIFRNNVKGTHERTEEAAIGITVLEAGQTIRFAKQPPRGGVGGNPFIWIEFCDENWNAMSNPILLGRCVQGLSTTFLDFGLMSNAGFEVFTGDCDNSGGPQITLSGDLLMGGVNAKLIFTNNAKWTHKHDERTEVGFVILPPGKSITFAKQPPRGGVGGNPRIYFQWMDSNGNSLSDEYYLGRCVQLSK